MESKHTSSEHKRGVMNYSYVYFIFKCPRLYRRYFHSSSHQNIMIRKPQIENGVEMRMFQLISLRMQSTKCISRWHQDISNVWMFMISPRNIQAVKHQWLLQCKRVFGKPFSPNGFFRHVFDYLLWLRYQHWAEAAFAPLIKTSHLLLGNHMIRMYELMLMLLLTLDE